LMQSRIISRIPFFLLLIRLPLRSTLFPYTTLFRSFSERHAELNEILISNAREKEKLEKKLKAFESKDRKSEILGFYTSRMTSFRSEEHTSELQSRENLVCRLLLEKKKKNKKKNQMN